MDDETVETESEGVFNCDTCPVRIAQDGLDRENRAAWELIQTLSTRFLVETHSVPVALMRLTADVIDPEEFADVMTRLSIIYDVQCPARKEPS